jgi:hypothetical protein
VFSLQFLFGVLIPDVPKSVKIAQEAAAFKV